MDDPQMFYMIDGKYYPGNETFFDLLKVQAVGSWASEEIHASGVNIQFLQDHYESLLEKISLLKIETPTSFSVRKLEDFIASLIKRNRHFGGNLLEINVFNASQVTGRKVPSNLLISIQALNEPDFRLNRKGLSIDIFDDINKPVNRLSAISGQYPPVLNLAGIYRDNKGLDDCLVLNPQGQVVESMQSNVFIVLGKKVLTPSENDGCQMTVIRSKLLKIIAGSSHMTIESRSVLPGDLIKADEIFLADIKNGIRWVVAFRQKRYYNQYAKMITELLNREAFGNTSSSRDSQGS